MTGCMKLDTHVIGRMAIGICAVVMMVVPEGGADVSAHHHAGSSYTVYLRQTLQKEKTVSKNIAAAAEKGDLQADPAVQVQEEETAEISGNVQSVSSETETVSSGAVQSAAAQPTAAAEETAAVQPEQSAAESSSSAETNRQETADVQTDVIDGSAGHLTIAALGIDVPLYTAADDAQSIVDAPQSAAYIDWYAVPVIADHAAQENFRHLADAAGQTALIMQNGVQKIYKCTEVYQGMNTGDDLTVNGTSCLTGADGDLIMYTCISSGDGSQVYIAAWQRIC